MKNYCVSVVIVNWNRVDYLRKCVNSLLESTYQNLEIIIVDNGSTDGSGEYVQHLMSKDNRFKLHRNKTNLGFALPSNQGAELATGDIIFLLNNDTIVDPECIEKVVALFKEQPEIGVVQPRLMQNETKMDEQGNLLMTNGYLLHFGFNCELSPLFLETYPVFSVKGAAFFVSRKVYSKIGLFRAEFFAFYEETDFCHRCWLAGHPIFYFGGAKVFHTGHVTASEFKEDKPTWIWFQSYRNRLISLSTLLTPKALLTTFALHIFITLLSAPILLLMRQWNICKAIIWAHWDISTRIPWIFKQRRSLRKQLNGFTEKEVFQDFGLMIKPPKGYMISAARGNLNQYWNSPVNQRKVEETIIQIQNQTNKILLAQKNNSR